MHARHPLLAVFISVLLLLAPIAAARSEQQPHIALGELAVRIHELVNREREAHGLHPLAWNEALATIAREHSEDMRERGYLDHVNPDGETPTDRGYRAGFRCRKKYDRHFEEGLAENLCRNSLFRAIRYTRTEERETAERLWRTLEELAASTVQSWMNHEEHRENLLNDHHDTQGIGIAIDGDGRVYVTQLFC